MDLIQIGSIDALVVSLILSPFIIRVAKYSTMLYIEKEILEYEINERKRTEQSLRLLEKAVKTTKTGITFCDENNIIRFTNPADAEMHGYTPEELLGQDVRIFAPAGVRKNLTELQLKEMKTWTRESVNVKKDGALFPVRLISDVVLGEKGEAIGIVTTCEDITERKDTEAAMEELVRQKDMFITRLGHDLKTPLTPLATLLPLIREQEENPKLMKLLDVTIQNVNGMKELVIKTLKLARASSVSMERRVEDIPLRGEVEGFISKRKYLIEKNGLAVRNDIAPEVFVRADRFDMEEVFYNLISNAVKYSPPGGEIRFGAGVEGDRVIVSVRDTGIGLTSKQIGHIFEEFYKVDESRHELDSSGLGLSICRKIIERLGGSIWAESPGKGLGTTIFFRIKSGASPPRGGARG